MLVWVAVALVVPCVPPVVATGPLLPAVMIGWAPPETLPRPVVMPECEVVPLDDVVWLPPLATV